MKPWLINTYYYLSELFQLGLIIAVLVWIFFSTIYTIQNWNPWVKAFFSSWFQQ
jgi:hypothetical protein